MERPPLFQITCAQCGNRQSVERRDSEAGFDILSCTSCGKKIKIILCGSCGNPHSVTLDAAGPERIPFTCRACSETFMVSLSGKEKPVEPPVMPVFRATAEELLLKNPDGGSLADPDEPVTLFGRVRELVTVRALAVSVPAALLVTAVVQLLALQLPGFDSSRQDIYGTILVWAGRGLTVTLIMILFMVNAVMLGAEEKGDVNRLGIGKALAMNGFVTLVILGVNLALSGFVLGISLLYQAWPVLTVFASLVLSPFIALGVSLLLYGLAFFPVMAGERENETVPRLALRFITFDGASTLRLAVRLVDFYALATLSFVLLALTDFLVKTGLGLAVEVPGSPPHTGLYSFFRIPLETVTGSPGAMPALLDFWIGTLYAAVSIGLTAFFMTLFSAFARVLYRKWREDSVSS